MKETLNNGVTVQYSRSSNRFEVWDSTDTLIGSYVSAATAYDEAEKYQETYSGSMLDWPEGVYVRDGWVLMKDGTGEIVEISDCRKECFYVYGRAKPSDFTEVPKSYPYTRYRSLREAMAASDT